MKTITTLLMLLALATPTFAKDKSQKQYQVGTILAVQTQDLNVWHDGLQCDPSTANCWDNGTGELVHHRWVIEVPNGVWVIQNANMGRADNDTLGVKVGDRMEFREAKFWGQQFVYVPRADKPNKEYQFVATFETKDEFLKSTEPVTPKPHVVLVPAEAK